MQTFYTDLWHYLKEQTGLDRPAVLYGTGDGADKIIRVLDSYGIPVSGIFASPGFVRDRSFHGIKVTSFEDLRERLGEKMIVLMCFGSSRPEVLSYVDEISSVCEFYAPDVPVYGDKLFDLEFYNSNLGLLREARALLADDLSQKTFDNICAARLTGDIRYLKEIEVTQEEADPLLPSSRQGLFLDLGAYDGDTVHRYASVFNDLTGIIAVEPDPRNMRKLKENTKAYSNIEYVNGFISDENATVNVKRNRGRGISIDKSGTQTTETATIDSLVKGRQTAFIKFDVEGAEAAAIDGGSDTIKNSRPAMCVACYHRSEDIIELPLKMISLNKDYKIYMRHTPSVPAWDTYYYFV